MSVGTTDLRVSGHPRVRLSVILHYAAPLAVYAMLSFVYVNYVAVTWRYAGHSADFSAVRFIFGAIAIVLTRTVVPIRMTDFRSVVLGLLSAINVTAMAAMFAARGFSPVYLLAVLAFFFIVVVISGRYSFRLPPRRSAKWVPAGICILGVLTSVAWIVANGGLSRLNFNLAEIYDLRSTAVPIYFTGPFAYLNNWATKVFAPALLALGIATRNPVLIAFSAGAGAFFYGSFGQKVPVAALIYVIGVMLVLPRRIPVYYVELFFLGLGGFCIYLYLQGQYELFALIMNRLFLNPALNNIIYFEFFSENELLLFSNTFFRDFVRYPYEMHVFDIISLIRTGDTAINPNTGVLGTAFMQLGYFGLLFYAVVIGFLIALIKSLTRDMPNWVPVALSGPAMFLMFLSTDLPTGILTEGLFLSVLLLFLWPTARAR